jgi:putative spermidine/putrescine transport system permease protein
VAGPLGAPPRRSGVIAIGESPFATRSFAARASAFPFRHPVGRALLLLLPGLLWLGVIYLGSLGAMLTYSFWRLEEFTGLIVREFSFETFGRLFEPANRDIIVRTAGMAAAVSIACAVLAFPLAYYMARYATPRMKTVLYLVVVMPLWSSYLVRALATRQILTQEGILMWAADGLGLDGLVRALLQLPIIGGPSVVTSYVGLFIAFVYLWLPFMILPVHAALERVPRSFLEASADLGGRPRTTFRRIALPLAKPGLVAGSIFTFSLTLGDFILPQIFGSSAFFLGQQVFVQQGVIGNLPLAAAFTFVSMAIMIGYLLIARRMGAFEAL